MKDDYKEMLKESILFKNIPNIILPCSMRFDLKKVESMILKEGTFNAVF